MKKMFYSLMTLIVLGTSTGYCTTKVDNHGHQVSNQKQETVVKGNGQQTTGNKSNGGQTLKWEDVNKSNQQGQQMQGQQTQQKQDNKQMQTGKTNKDKKTHKVSKKHCNCHCKSCMSKNHNKKK